LWTMNCLPHVTLTSKEQATCRNIPAPPNDARWALVESWLSEDNRTTQQKSAPLQLCPSQPQMNFPNIGLLSCKMRWHSSGHGRFSMKRDKSVMTTYCGGQTSFVLS
jgi:hypothetical protein